jgi:dehydrogenase/reductase SDR family member 12
VELTFATHVLAPWVLIEGLTPLLRAAGPSRVINVPPAASMTRRSLAGTSSQTCAKCGPERIYARTKREELVLTEQWAQRLAGTSVHVHAMHPCWADTAGVRNWMPAFRALTRPVIRTPEQGADTIHRLARRRPGGCRDDRAVLA